jgi:hypothetical protein
MNGISGYFDRCQEKNMGNYNKLPAIYDGTDMQCPLLVCSGVGIEIAGVYNDRRSLGLPEAGM